MQSSGAAKLEKPEAIELAVLASGFPKGVKRRLQIIRDFMETSMVL